MTTRVLIVDDLDRNLFLLGEVLEGLADEILSACSGEEALELVEELHPEVVVLDYQMPGMDGAEVCRFIKNREDLPFIWVMILSGYHEAEGIRSAEADCFLGKPYQLADVRQAVDDGLRIAATRRAS